jgi:hypothetical protein
MGKQIDRGTADKPSASPTLQPPKETTPLNFIHNVLSKSILHDERLSFSERRSRLNCVGLGSFWLCVAVHFFGLSSAQRTVERQLEIVLEKISNSGLPTTEFYDEIKRQAIEKSSFPKMEFSLREAIDRERFTAEMDSPSSKVAGRPRADREKMAQLLPDGCDPAALPDETIEAAFNAVVPGTYNGFMKDFLFPPNGEIVLGSDCTAKTLLCPGLRETGQEFLRRIVLAISEACGGDMNAARNKIAMLIEGYQGRRAMASLNNATASFFNQFRINVGAKIAPYVRIFLNENNVFVSHVDTSPKICDVAISFVAPGRTDAVTPEELGGLAPAIRDFSLGYYTSSTPDGLPKTHFISCSGAISFSRTS